MFTPETRRQLAQGIATTIGTALGQSYRQIDGKWWLFTRETAQRVLADDEVAWHVARRHKPFISDGIDTSHPDWWKDPQ